MLFVIMQIQTNIMNSGKDKFSGDCQSFFRIKIGRKLPVSQYRRFQRGIGQKTADQGNCSVVCEGERTYGSSGEVSEGSPSDCDPFQRHVTAYRVHGPDAAPARSEAEGHPEPFPQDR